MLRQNTNACIDITKTSKNNYIRIIDRNKVLSKHSSENLIASETRYFARLDNWRILFMLKC